MAVEPITPFRQAPAAAPRRRPLRGRLSAGHVVMLVAALAAVVVNYSLLRAQDATVRVAVAGGDLRAGQPVSAGDFEFADIVAGDALLDALLMPTALTGVEGHIAERAIAAGEPVRRSDLRPPGAPTEQRAMSIPVGREHAVAGALAAGDRVDVIAVTDGRARYVVTGAEVLAVAGDASAGVLGGGGSFSVTVAVDAETALRIAAAVRAETVDVVRSTGAPQADTDAAYEPPGRDDVGAPVQGAEPAPAGAEPQAEDGAAGDAPAAPAEDPVPEDQAAPADQPATVDQTEGGG